MFIAAIFNQSVYLSNQCIFIETILSQSFYLSNQCIFLFPRDHKDNSRKNLQCSLWMTPGLNQFLILATWQNFNDVSPFFSASSKKGLVHWPCFHPPRHLSCWVQSEPPCVSCTERCVGEARCGSCLEWHLFGGICSVGNCPRTHVVPSLLVCVHWPVKHFHRLQYLHVMPTNNFSYSLHATPRFFQRIHQIQIKH